MSKALYRKYRPKTLADVVGQKQVVDVLAKSLEQNKISHAYLFIGPRGTGKTSIARIFAHAINKFKYEIEDDYVDIIEIDGASNRGIDNIRDLREKATIAPTKGKYKVYIIDEVHMLTNEAFNALLKTLEEPPSHVIFIMATTDAYKVPITITSRAQTFTFSLADTETMLNFLKGVAEKEKIDIDDAALRIIVKRGGGSFRDSLSLLDQISTLSDKKITKEVAIAAMGLPSDELVDKLLNEYLAGDVVKITTVLREILNSGVKAETLAEELIGHIMRNPDVKYFSLLSKLPDIRSPFAEAKLLVALAPVNSPKSCPESKSVTQNSEEKQPNQTAADQLEKKNFDWRGFLENVKKLNDVVFSRLEKCEYEIKHGSLEIYPSSRIVKNILESTNNRKILEKLYNGEVIIRAVDDSPKKYTNDTTIAKISDIMGGKVKEDGGKNPFN